MATSPASPTRDTETDLSQLAPPMSVGPTPAPSAGWYGDPTCSGALRYWDGTAWGAYALSVAQTSAPGTSDGKGIQVAGYMCVVLSALMPAIGIAGLILGILTTTKRGRGGHGAAIIVLSILVSAISFVVYYNVILHHAAASVGACYFDTAGNARPT